MELRRRTPSDEEMKSDIQNIFLFIGDDPNREGLKDTPKRMVKAWKELFGGYDLKREDVLNTTFAEHGKYDSIVMLKDIDFFTFCEHHFLPFQGKAHVAYIPSDKVVGISKLARLVDMHSRKLQIQEKMTMDIANDLFEVLTPQGVAVILEAHHSCMGCRGIKKPNGKMITSRMMGIFETDLNARNELMQLLRGV